MKTPNKHAQTRTHTNTTVWSLAQNTFIIYIPIVYLYTFKTMDVSFMTSMSQSIFLSE